MDQHYQNRVIQGGIIGYWFLFWLLNCLDKVFGGRNAFFVGKDRLSQFEGYFETIGMTAWQPLSALIFVSILEILAFGFLAVALYAFFTKKANLEDRTFFWGTFLGLLIFSIFSIGDQVFGDRFELMEHTIYWTSLIASWGAYEFFPRLLKK